MTRRLGFEQWLAIAVAILLVTALLGAASVGVARYEALANAAAAEPDGTGAPAPSRVPFGDTAPATGATGDSSLVLSAVSPTRAGDHPGTTTTTTSGAHTTRTSSATTTTKAPTTATATTTTSTTTTSTTTSTTTTSTTTTSPPSGGIQYYAGDAADFCSRLNAVRIGAGKPAMASCTESPSLTSATLQMAQAKSVWHVGTNEIVGFTYGIGGSEKQRLVDKFKASSQHYPIIVNGGASTTAKVGCYYRDDPADEPYVYLFCIAQFTY